MQLLIFGAGGQVGRALAALAPPGTVALGRADCDIRDRGAVLEAVARHRPALVVNCAAFTAVDRAETERALAFAVNAEGARHAAEAAAAIGAPILHLSTDYVYGEGATQPHREEEAMAPINAYGASKAAGDAAVAAANPAHLLLRVSWVFSAGGSNFVCTVLRLAGEARALRIVDDQIGGPTEAGDIAAAIVHIAARCRAPRFSAWGLYHFSGAPAVSWCDFARAIVAQARLAVPVEAIASADFATPARRPRNSVLDCGRIAQVFGVVQPDWRSALDRILCALVPAGGPAR